MKYIYDILLNFNEVLYDYYEWKETDYIEYIKKIPLIKLSKKNYKNLKDYKIAIDKDLLDKIYNITEVYMDKTIRLIEYSCLFTDGEDVIGVEFNYKGFSIMKSKLLLDECDEVLEISNSIKETDLKYEIISKEEENRFITRNELEKVLFLNREIKILYKEKCLEKLKYLYYECFNIIEDSIEYIYNTFILFINKEWNENHNKLYNLLKLTYINK